MDLGITDNESILQITDQCTSGETLQFKKNEKCLRMSSTAVYDKDYKKVVHCITIELLVYETILPMPGNVMDAPVNGQAKEKQH